MAKNTPSAGKGLNTQVSTPEYRANPFWEEAAKKTRAREIISLTYKVKYGNDQEREDAKARLEFLEWEKGEEEK